MSRLKVFAIAGLAVIAPLGAARAADVPMSLPPLVQKAPVFVEEYQSGWYLRGDLGYRMNDLDGISAVIGAVPSGTTIDDRFTIGGGGGYKSGWFRADVTIDYALACERHRGHARLPHEGRYADHACESLSRSRHMVRHHAICRRGRRHGVESHIGLFQQCAAAAWYRRAQGNDGNLPGRRWADCRSICRRIC